MSLRGTNRTYDGLSLEMISVEAVYIKITSIRIVVNTYLYITIRIVNDINTIYIWFLHHIKNARHSLWVIIYCETDTLVHAKTNLVNYGTIFDILVISNCVCHSICNMLKYALGTPTCTYIYYGSWF